MSPCYYPRSYLYFISIQAVSYTHLVMVLSGGEQAKLRLCKLLNTPYNVLFLDEPTNHLDQDAKDELHKAIAEYPGTVLLVCHEKEFYTDLADAIWDLSEVSLRR